MEKVGERIWTQTQDFITMKVNLGARMTVIQVTGNELILYSPVRLTDELKAELDALGKVCHIIAPNGFHHLFVGDYVKAYPHAKLYGMAELQKKRPDLKSMNQIGGLQTNPWGPDVTLITMLGSSVFNEVMLYHKPSRSLLVCDVAFNFQHFDTLWERTVARLYGTYKKFGPSMVARKFMKKHPQAKEAMRRAMSYDFQRVIPCHGEILDKDAKNIFTNAFRYLF